MTSPMTPEEVDALARKRAGAKMGWYTHALVFTLINLYWFLASDLGFGYKTWSPKLLLGWGLGLALHFIAVFVLGGGSSLRERMVQKERERLQREQNRMP
ncbi:2TM domain-containing protein [Caenimonas aquaedulcis]|uniref:2TM domain-containing protein n=1 Tax=Caenimonas aquaedulcis TaxID=2793270 RepID=A0A931H3B9_9BURK|nr:2TM domain-containing protein [Caenimonas aquaedulcis]MBG9387735.1 2TM domain-containing protein [Caenimonas aquaedulcis]